MNRTTILAEPLTRGAFAPYGEILQAPETIGREHFAADLVNLRPGARLNLSLSKSPVINPALEISELEHHPYSAQAFIPIDVTSYVVLVALNDEDNRPAVPSLKAFIATQYQGICFKPGVWHLGMTTIDRPGAFALLVYEDGTPNDCIFQHISAIRLQIPAAVVFS